MEKLCWNAKSCCPAWMFEAKKQFLERAILQKSAKVPPNPPPRWPHPFTWSVHPRFTIAAAKKKKRKTPNWYTMVYMVYHGIHGIHGILAYHGIHVMSQPFCDSYPIRGASSLSLYIPGFLYCGLHPHPRPTHTETQFLRPARSVHPRPTQTVTQPPSQTVCRYIPVLGIAAWTASTFSFLIRNYYKKVLNALSAHRKPNFIWS